MPFDTQVSSAIKLSSIQFLNILALLAKWFFASQLLFMSIACENSLVYKGKWNKWNYIGQKQFISSAFKLPENTVYLKIAIKDLFARSCVCGKLWCFLLHAGTFLCTAVAAGITRSITNCLFVRWVFVEQEEITWVPIDRSNFFITVHSSVQFLHQACFLSSHS